MTVTCIATASLSSLLAFRPPLSSSLAPPPAALPLSIWSSCSLTTSSALPVRAFLPFDRSRFSPAFAYAGGGGDSGGVGGGGSGGGDSGEGGEEPKGKGDGMSMSQKLTLAYATLVGVGGVIGYIKSGSQKSAIAGGSSALLLYFVYTQLPVRPALASSLGLGLSAALLSVMGSRFKKSGKVFPAGVVSIVSLIMVGGYLHGILRSMHA